MLKIHYGLRADTIDNIDIEFRYGFDETWLKDQLVKDMILDVDKSKVLAPYCIESPVLGQILPFMLSGGVKALILMLKTQYAVNASHCGDNCAKWIKKIAEIKDIEIDLEHIMYFDTDDTSGSNDFHAFFINDGTYVNSYTEYLAKMLDLVEESRDREI